jgi:phospholipid/cholesterol/gamma-HCH transport system substrate-binding protein
MKSFTERNPYVIGITAIVVIGAITIGSLVLNASFFARLSHNFTIDAVFPDTAGLRGADRVTIAGVQVGTVGSLTQDGNAVRVSLKINHGVQIPDDSKAAIRVATILGRKEVGISTGNDWGHLLKGGDIIPEDRTSSPTEVLAVQTDAQSALQDLDANALNTFLHDLAQVTSGKRTEVGTIIDGLNRLTSTVDARRTDLSNLLTAANTVSSTLASRDQQLLSIVDNLDVVLRGLADRKIELTQLLDNAQAAANQISGLVSANRAKLDSILAELHTDLGIIGQHQVDLAQSVAYLGSAVQGFQSIGYSGPTNTPNTWANVFTVGLGPVSADPVFGCGGALDQALNAALGPDPLPCSQSVGPVASSLVSGVPAASAAGAAAAVGAAPTAARSSTRTVPIGSASTTADSLNALLVPLLAG